MDSNFNKDQIELGTRIRRLRRSHDLCQEAFAEALDVSAMTVSRIENGTTRLNVPLLIKMSEVLNVSIEEILGIPQRGVNA